MASCVCLAPGQTPLPVQRISGRSMSIPGLSIPLAQVVWLRLPVQQVRRLIQIRLLFSSLFRLAVHKLPEDKTLGKTHGFIGVHKLLKQVGIDTKIFIARAIGKRNF
ncbi:MAG: hypothetical protein RLZZ65_1544 [Bacteroidota bacterium]